MKVPRGFIAVALAAALAGCTSTSSQTISEVYASHDGTKLQAIVNACSDDTVVEVFESPDRVGLAATAPAMGTGKDCQTAVVVTLGSRLAQRPVVDLRTGEVLDVTVDPPGADWASAAG